MLFHFPLKYYGIFLTLALMPLTIHGAVASIHKSEKESSGAEITLAQALAEMPVEDLASVSAAGLKKKLGRKLTLQERIALKILRHKARRFIKKGKPLNTTGPRNDGFAMAAGVVGIVSLTTLFFSFFFGAALGVVALILASIGSARIRKAPEQKKGKWFAIPGIIAGGVGLMGLLFYLLFSNLTFAI